MASFDEAVSLVLKEEGGYSDNPNDHGGATAFGISLSFIHTINPLATADYIKSLTKNDAIKIYKQHFWDRWGYGSITNQELANCVFSMAVNTGPMHATKCLQRCIRAVNGTILADDGNLGFKSLVAINTANPKEVLIAYKSQMECYYRNLNQPVFLQGWLHRLYS
jgi:lysozyme family protein